MPVARLRVIHRSIRSLLPEPRHQQQQLAVHDVLEQQLSQQLSYALPLDAILRQFHPRLPRQFQQPVRVTTGVKAAALCGPK